jgi:hypothetical protein
MKKLILFVFLAFLFIFSSLAFIAQAPTVEVKSTETASVTLSSEILRNIPTSQFTADIVTLRQFRVGIRLTF